MPFGSSTDYLRRTGAAGRLVAAFAFLMVAFLGTAQAAPLNIVVVPSRQRASPRARAWNTGKHGRDYWPICCEPRVTTCT